VLAQGSQNRACPHDTSAVRASRFAVKRNSLQSSAATAAAAAAAAAGASATVSSTFVLSCSLSLFSDSLSLSFASRKRTLVITGQHRNRVCLAFHSRFFLFPIIPFLRFLSLRFPVDISTPAFSAPRLIHLCDCHPFRSCYYNSVLIVFCRLPGLYQVYVIFYFSESNVTSYYYY